MVVTCRTLATTNTSLHYNTHNTVPGTANGTRLEEEGGVWGPHTDLRPNENLFENGGGASGPQNRGRTEGMECRGGGRGNEGTNRMGAATTGGDAGEGRRRRKAKDDRMAQKTAVRVATLNMNGFGNLIRDHPDNKWGRIYRMMSEQRIGILMLQETHLTEERREQIQRMFAGRVKIFASPHPDSPTQKEGVAVVINKKIVSAKGAKCEVIVPGRAIQLAMPWRGGTLRQLLCVYAPTSAGVADRCEFYERVSRYYEQNPDAPKPHLMAGDFNNVEDLWDRLPCVGTARDASTGKLDDLKAALSLMRRDGWRTTYPDCRDYTFQRRCGENVQMSRLDRIYVTDELMRWAKEWTITPVGVKTDHNLVSVLLTEQDAPEVGRGRPVFPMHLLKDKVLARRMREIGFNALREIEEVARVGRTDDRNPQIILASLKKVWLSEAREREKRTTPKLDRVIGELEKRLKEVTRSTQPPNEEDAREREALTEQLRQKKEKRIKQKQKKMRARHRVLGERPTKYWTALHRERAPRELIPSFEKEGERTREGERVYERNTEKMAEMAREHYDNVQKDGPDCTTGDRRRQDIETALASLTAKLTREQADDLGNRIEWDDVELALRFAKAGTAPGIDGIQYEVWKTMHARFVEDSRHPGRNPLDVVKILAAALGDIQMYGVARDTGFADGWVCPIYKEKGERTRVVNYRPITLLNTDYKLLSKVLAIRLAATAPDIVHPAQAGFVPGRRLHNHTQLARLMMSWAEVADENGAIVALDQEKAYDKIAHDYLWAVLSKLGVPESFTKIVQSLYANAMTSVAVNGVTSRVYRVYRGVRQGDPLSCLLFDLAIEPLSAMIRNSGIKGFDIPNSRESLKATLFADDTTVYLAEGDDFAVLQAVLDTWCSAAKAKFNILKTEIIPIGSKEYRKKFIETYKQSGAWKNYPRGVHVVGEGEAVRILGAYFGNGADQEHVWRPKLDKVEAAIRRWNEGHATMIGRKHTTQMMIGGMSQFFANVQRMPSVVLRDLKKMVRSYVWDGKTHAPVALDYLCLPIERGGLGLLDLEARNDAIDIMWLKRYMATGPERPLWAFVADALLAACTPKTVFPRERELRGIPFTQQWRPKMAALPLELKAMVKVADKYGLRQEGLAFSRGILRSMPIWGHAQSDQRLMKKLSTASAVTRCLKRNHAMVTVGDCERLLGYASTDGHNPRGRCACAGCEKMIVEEYCTDPGRCLARATALMDLLPSKWDPRGEHPEDYEETQMDVARNEMGDMDVFDRRVTTHGGLGDTFRIFTGLGGVHNGRIDMRIAEGGGEVLEVATDGSCNRNGEANAVAGAGIFVAQNDNRNRAVRLPGSIAQTNQTGETIAALLAARTRETEQPMLQVTDSKTVMTALTTRRSQLEDTGFIGQKNGDITLATIAAIRARKSHTAFKWVKGHNGHVGNEAADKLAATGAAKTVEDDLADEINVPNSLKLTGAKLLSLTQKLAYRAVRDRKEAKLPPRPTTARNIARIQNDLLETTGHKPTEEGVWKSLRKIDVSRECAQFMWKSIHDAFMVGKHWLRPKMSDELKERATCKLCGVTESMEHIIFDCIAEERKEIWGEVQGLWNGAMRSQCELTWGTVFGAGCVTLEDERGIDMPYTGRLWTVLVTESAYLVWKLRCERVIQNEGRPFTRTEVKNRWFATINGRLDLDRRTSVPWLGGEKLSEAAVDLIWRPVIEDASLLPHDWVRNNGVLVGIRGTKTRQDARNEASSR
ncbi:Transposon TX1 uncharacterized 149 kDa protein [Trametes pubescens]|uniref:Transposon TX1 uncharacterized 149 kDa protein n=1 Tax=Trametes pubescens TaxID=154538 RepID=A0A1M2W3W9_TRAPU|nr:Transposon TX1 uncharacterized 149 kDa protein [Trametes pubescens]